MARTAKRKFSRTGTLLAVSRVHYQLIPSEKPSEYNCSGIIARLTALICIDVQHS